MEKGCERKEYAGGIATERECHGLKAFPAGSGGKCIREPVRRSRLRFEEMGSSRSRVASVMRAERAGFSENSETVWNRGKLFVAG